MSDIEYENLHLLLCKFVEWHAARGGDFDGVLGIERQSDDIKTMMQAMKVAGRYAHG